MSERVTHILCVDDDRDTRTAMVHLLRRYGFTVAGAGTCEAAVRCAAESPVDLLITDLLLPDGDGRVVLEAIRARGMPVEAILVTGVSDELATSKGFARQLIKPVPFPTLLAAIADVLAACAFAAVGARPFGAAAARPFGAAPEGAAAGAPAAATLVPPGRITALREKVRRMTAQELSDLSASLRRRGADLAEETRVLQDIIAVRLQYLHSRRHPPLP